MPMRLLTAADLPAATVLLERAGLPSGAANVGRYLRWQPDGCWCNDELTGMVTVLCHGTVGFVGCMAVEPSEQGRGLGRAVLEHAQAHATRAGVETFLLEATPDGRRLYEKLGYVVEHATINVARAVTAGSAATAALLREVDAIRSLDAVATGTPRPMIADLVASFAGAAVEVGGALAAYGLVIGDRLGPVIARDVAAGNAVVAALAPACRIATVPEPNQAARRALADAGFADVRVLARMRLGPRVASRVEWVWTLASAGAG
jgi:GNAT superfamily N-acetyltransferase